MADRTAMSAPGVQSSLPAREIAPESYIFLPGGWTQVARVETDETRSIVIIEVEFRPDEEVPICRPIR